MAKTKISEFSSTPGNNTDIDGINIAEGCAPSGINDAIRELMAQLKDFQAGDAGDSITVVGTLAAKGTSSAAADLKLYEDTDNGTNYVGFIAPASIASNIQWTLPSADGSSGQALQTNGSGTLSFATLGISAGGTGQTTANAAFNALAPSQTSNAGRYLKTDGTNTSWDLLDISTADITGTLPVANGGTGLTSFTANGIVYASSSSALTTGSALTFDGTYFTANGLRLAGADVTNTIYQATGSLGISTGSATGITFATNLTTRYSIDATGVAVWSVGGSEQMRLTSTGLGIGTSSPSHRLVVSQSETTAYAASSGSVVEPAGGANTQILNTGSGGFASLRFASLSGSYAQGYLAFVNNGGSALGYFAFGQRSGSGYAEQMRLDSSGNLGLGVTPSAWSSSFKALNIGVNGQSVSADGGQIIIGSNYVQESGGAKYVVSAAAGSYAIARNSHYWYIAPSGTAGNAISFTQAMTLDASGNWMTGTTTAIGRATVVGGTSQLAFHDGNGSNTNYGLLNYGGSSGELTLNANSTGGNTLIRFLTSNGGSNAERARITSGGYFKASNTGSYIDSTGAYYEFNQSAASNAALAVNASSASYTNYVAYLQAARNTTDNSFYAIGYFNTGAAAYKFLVADSGNVTNTNGSYGTISDQKMKTDIVDAGSQWSDIKALRFRKFKMKDDPSGLVQLGVVAQEVELTSPGLVNEHTDRDAEGNDLGTTTKSVKTSVLLMKAAVALQEAMARIETLEAKIAALEAK